MFMAKDFFVCAASDSAVEVFNLKMILCMKRPANQGILYFESEIAAIKQTNKNKP